MKVFTISLVLLFSITANCQLWVWKKPTQELERNILGTIKAALAKMPFDYNRAKYKNCRKVECCGIDGDKRGIVLQTVGNDGWGTKKGFSNGRSRYFGVYYLVMDKNGNAASNTGHPKPIELDQFGCPVMPYSKLDEFNSEVWSGGKEDNAIFKMKFTIRLKDSAAVQLRLEEPDVYFFTLGVKNFLRCLTVVGVPFAVRSVGKELIPKNVELSDKPIPATMDCTNE